MKHNELTLTIKAIIAANSLIDTGLLYLSTEVHIRVRQRIEIDIQTTDYYEYLDRKYDLTDSLIESNAMGVFMREEYNRYIDRYINKVFRGGVKDVTIDNIMQINLAPVITINGGMADSSAQRLAGDLSTR